MRPTSLPAAAGGEQRAMVLVTGNWCLPWTLLVSELGDGGTSESELGETLYRC